MDVEAFADVTAIESIFAPDQPNGESPRIILDRIIHEIFTHQRSRESFRLLNPQGGYYDIDALHLLLEVNNRLLLIRFFRDITEELRKEHLIQKQLEVLNQQNQKLQTYIESNMQLENFAYIASHDLQAPIRSMVSFANLLQRRLSGRLETEEDDFFTIYRSGCTQYAVSHW